MHLQPDQEAHLMIIYQPCPEYYQDGADDI